MAWTSSDSRPAYLGRGRGRGTEGNGTKARQAASHFSPGANASIWTSQLKESDEMKEYHMSPTRGSEDVADEETEDGDQLDSILFRLLQSYAVQAENEEGHLFSLVKFTNNKTCMPLSLQYTVDELYWVDTK